MEIAHASSRHPLAFFCRRPETACRSDRRAAASRAGGMGLASPKNGGIDRNAIDRINAIDEAGLTRDLQEALVNRRLNYFKGLDNFDSIPGWVTRAEYFR